MSNNLKPKSANENPSAAELEYHISELQKAVVENERAVQVQSALLEIANLSGNVHDLKNFYSDLHNIVDRLMYAENFYIALLTEDKRHVAFEYFLDEQDAPELDPTSWAPEPIKKFNPTLTGYVLRTGNTLLADEEKLRALQASGEILTRGSWPSSWLGVPLKMKGTTIGVLAVQSYQEEITFNEHDREVLNFVCQQIAAALTQKRYEQQLRKYNEELEQTVSNRTAMLQEINHNMEQEIKERKQAELMQRAMLKISEAAHDAKDMDHFYLELHRVTNSIMPSKNFYISTYDNNSRVISFPYFVDKYESQVSPRKVNFDSPINQSPPTEQVLRTGTPLLINEHNRDKWFKVNASKGKVSETWLGVPLLEKKQVVGVLATQSYTKGRSYSKLDEEVLLFVAHQVSIALEKRKNAESLLQAHQQLTKINDELELRVEARTKELSLSNTTLQNMLNEHSRMQKKLAFEAFHDSLTGLPNRTLFTNRLEHLLQQMQRDKKVCFSVLFLDLDRFKVINDSLGHLVGDALLQQVSLRLELCVRPNDTVARLGGDEFCILLKGINKERDAAVIADRILSDLAEPYELHDQTVFTSTSIGVTLSNASYESPDDVLRDADAAMYHAKESGKNCYTLFDKEMHSKAVKRLRIENELRKAVSRDEICAYYQPVIDLQSGRIIAFEALARWTHSDLGFVSPVDFIPVAEEIGVIHELGDFMLNQSLSTLKKWHDTIPEATDISMNVNFSSKQIETHDLLQDIEAALSNNTLEPIHLKVEVTESLLIENSDLAQQLLSGLQDRNIMVMLDDFGTGYSSLSYLNKFVLSAIKIDRSFIYEMDQNDKHRTLVKTIAYMSHSLNLNVVAEGVENIIHAGMLKELGIQYGQGYYYSKPIPENEVQDLILKYNS